MMMLPNQSQSSLIISLLLLQKVWQNARLQKMKKQKIHADDENEKKAARLEAKHRLKAVVAVEVVVAVVGQDVRGQAVGGQRRRTRSVAVDQVVAEAR